MVSEKNGAFRAVKDVSEFSVNLNGWAQRQTFRRKRLLRIMEFVSTYKVMYSIKRPRLVLSLQYAGSVEERRIKCVCSNHPGQTDNISKVPN